MYHDKMLVSYSDYESMNIEYVKMLVDCDRYKILEPTTRIIKVEDGDDIEEKVLRIKTIDDRMVFEMVQDLDQKDLGNLIRVLQLLNKQLVTSNNNNINCR